MNPRTKSHQIYISWWWWIGSICRTGTLNLKHATRLKPCSLSVCLSVGILYSTHWNLCEHTETGKRTYYSAKVDSFMGDFAWDKISGQSSISGLELEFNSFCCKLRLCWFFLLKVYSIDWFIKVWGGRVEDHIYHFSHVKTKENKALFSFSYLLKTLNVLVILLWHSYYMNSDWAGVLIYKCSFLSF